jgi:hypothetical protein
MFHDGDKVRVDGSTETAELLDPASAPAVITIP